jgi:hypothetical protein
MALLVAGAASAAEPPEPLTVTRLADSESELLVSASASGARSQDAPADGFSRAVGDALRKQQQSIEAQCQSAQRGSGPIATQWAWEARCRYRRY